LEFQDNGYGLRHLFEDAQANFFNKKKDAQANRPSNNWIFVLGDRRRRGSGRRRTTGKSKAQLGL